MGNLAKLSTLRLAGNDVLVTGNSEALERYFYEQLRLYPWFSGLYFGGTDGSFIYVKREEAGKDDQTFLTKIVSIGDAGRKVEFIKHGKEFEVLARSVDPNDKFDPRTRPWFAKSRDEKGLAWTDPYIFFTSQRTGISATGPVMDNTPDRSRTAPSSSRTCPAPESVGTRTRSRATGAGSSSNPTTHADRRTSDWRCCASGATPRRSRISNARSSYSLG